MRDTHRAVSSGPLRTETFLSVSRWYANSWRNTRNAAYNFRRGRLRSISKSVSISLKHCTLVPRNCAILILDSRDISDIQYTNPKENWKTACPVLLNVTCIEFYEQRLHRLWLMSTFKSSKWTFILLRTIEQTVSLALNQFKNHFESTSPSALLIFIILLIIIVQQTSTVFHVPDTTISPIRVKPLTKSWPADVTHRGGDFLNPVNPLLIQRSAEIRETFFASHRDIATSFAIFESKFLREISVR